MCNLKLAVVRTLPQRIYIAFSGGVDSVVMAHRAQAQGRQVTLAFFNHGNELAAGEQAFVEKFAKEQGLDLVVGYCNRPISGSKEQFWRDCRYEFFHNLPDAVATGHNLDDAVEWYMLTCLRGQGHYMEYKNGNVIRPLLLTPKSEILEYAQAHDLKWFEDPSNQDWEFTYRNKIRHAILPTCFEINPGLRTVVANNIRRKLGE